MKFNQLGRTDLRVSEICLGSMTWGTQNTEAEGHAQIDYALEQGVNFIDTAELYPTTPLGRDTQGDTESIIGSWIEKTGRRSDVIIATKVAGNGAKTVRDSGPITPASIRVAVEASLKRLRTDYIDVYQLHWPNRGSYCFRQNWTYDPTKQPARSDVQADILSVLEALEDEVKAGRIRHVGLSNETAWGMMQYLTLADQHTLPRMHSVQNEYSLLYRQYDLDLAELTQHEDVGLLAYSPLAAGLLSGKYANGAIPDGSRMSLNRALGGRNSERALGTVAIYADIAAKHGLFLPQMALAFCLGRPFMTSTIIGATTTEQLATNIAAKDVALTDEVLADIDLAHRAHPWPF